MYPVATLGAAHALVRAFIEDNGLGGGNLPLAAGRVWLDGKPFAHISYNGRIWRVNGKWKESGQELDESGKKTDDKDCNCKKTEPEIAPATGTPKARTKTAANHGGLLGFDVGVGKTLTGIAAIAAPPSAPPASSSKPKPERKPKAARAQKSAEPAPPKAALSDAEAEELANLFAAASAEDKPK